MEIDNRRTSLAGSSLLACFAMRLSSIYAEGLIRESLDCDSNITFEMGRLKISLGSQRQVCWVFRWEIAELRESAGGRNCPISQALKWKLVDTRLFALKKQKSLEKAGFMTAFFLCPSFFLLKLLADFGEKVQTIKTALFYFPGAIFNDFLFNTPAFCSGDLKRSMLLIWNKMNQQLLEIGVCAF